MSFRAPYQVKEGEVLAPPDHELWIRSGDNVHRTAEDIIHAMTFNTCVDLACIGAACVNVAMKAVAVAREKIESVNGDYYVQPWFSSIIDDSGRDRTRLMLRVSVVPINPNLVK